MNVFEVYESMGKGDLNLNKIYLLQKLLGDLEPFKQGELLRCAKHLEYNEAQYAEEIAQNILQRVVAMLVVNMAGSKEKTNQEILQRLFEKERPTEGEGLGFANCA